MSKLPAKLSTLLRIAVEDAQKIRTDPKYREDYRCGRSTMNTWHAPEDQRFDGETRQFEPAKPKCEVCLGGAVMAIELKVPKDARIAPFDYGGEVGRKIHAIDSMRRGDFDDAFVELKGREPTERQRVALARANKAYGRRKTLAPWATYLKCARILEKAGL